MTNFADILRLLHNLIRLGTIAEVDSATARVRVQSGENLTDWRPWLSARAGTTKAWDPPTIGEQVLLLSPSGDLAQAIVLTGIYSDANPAPAASAELWRHIFPDGTQLDYDHSANRLTIEAVGDLLITAGGVIDITAAGNVTIQGAQVHLN